IESPRKAMLRIATDPPCVRDRITESTVTPRVPDSTCTGEPSEYELTESTSTRAESTRKFTAPESPRETLPDAEARADPVPTKSARNAASEPLLIRRPTVAWLTGTGPAERVSAVSATTPLGLAPRSRIA